MKNEGLKVIRLEIGKDNKKINEIHCNEKKPAQKNDCFQNIDFEHIEGSDLNSLLDHQQLLLNRNKGQRLILAEKQFVYDEINLYGKEEKST